MTTSRLLPCLALVALLSAEAAAQRAPIRIGTGRQPRARSIYERPTFSPWVGGDLGLGGPTARCVEECGGRGYGGFAGVTAGAVGFTVLSRLTLAAERSWMNVLEPGNDPPSTASLTMGTARFGTRRGLLAKVGYGKARFSAGPTRLIDDRPVWMVGTESCALARFDLCITIDYSQADLGSPVYYNFNTETAQYRMRTLRAGLAGRFHLLRGRRVTLPSQEPVVRTGSQP